jgi:hypothetical protein
MVLGATVASCGDDTGLSSAPPEPAPDSTTTFPLPHLPNPEPSSTVATVPPLPVSGGGPTTGDEFAQRISALMPQLSTTYDTAIGPAAFDYIRILARIAIRELNPIFTLLDTVGTCAVEEGVVGATVYVSQDLTAAGAMVVFSRVRAQEFGRVLIDCLLPDFVTAGGGASLFSPCVDAYELDLMWDDGYQDHYFVYVGGTSQSMCDTLKGFHNAYAPVG